MLGVVGLVGMRHVVRSPVDFVRIQPTRPTNQPTNQHDQQPNKTKIPPLTMVRQDEKIFLKKNGQTLSCLEASEGEVIVMKVASTTAAPTRPINFHQFTFLQENSDRLYIFWGAAMLHLL